MVAYSAAGLISVSRPNLPAQSQCGYLILIMACSTSFCSVSTLRLDGGHSVIRVKVILTIASDVAYTKAASAAADDMISCFSVAVLAIFLSILVVPGFDINFVQQC